MADPSRRQHERFACSVAAALHTPSSGVRLGEAVLVDISLGGGSIETGLALQRRVPYELRWTWAGQELRVPARVTWETKADASKRRRYGLTFTMTAEQEALVKRLVDAARLDPWR